MYHGTVAPSGYLACDGEPFSATQYPKLYARLGASTTPDLRGCFVRGLDPSGSRDPDGASRAPGSYQADALQEIEGEVGCHAHDASAWAAGCFSLGAFSNEGPRAWGDHNNPSVKFKAGNVARTAAETRPKNASLLFCIKHD